MLKPVIKSCVILTLLAAFPVFADEPLSTFHKQGEVSYASQPLGQEAYYAEKAPFATVSSGYFGLDFGPNVNSLRTEVIINKIYSGSNNKSIVSYGVTGFGGYGANFNHLYLGSELSAYYNFLDKRINNVVNTDSGARDAFISIQYPLSLGLDFIPGYVTDSRDFLLYGRLGVGLSMVKLRLLDTTGGRKFSDKTNKFVFGLRIGLGAEYFVSSNFGLRLEYLYVGYNKVSEYRHASPNSKTYNYRLGGTGSHQIKLGLLVHF